MYNDAVDNMHWPEQEQFDGLFQTDAAGRKRASRACDQCRKTKSKCEQLVEGGPCRNCAESNLVCTFLGPTYKRGPPKGYLHAIEQRWYQAETILGAILASPDPRVKDVISALQQDDLAREVLNRVDAGPFGPTGRSSRPAGATMQDIFHSFMATNERQTQRQSRASREIVSTSQDSRLSPNQAAAWQDRLTSLLASSPTSRPALNHSSATDQLEHSMPQGRWTPSDSGEPDINRRRLKSTSLEQPDFNNMYSLDSSSDGTHEFLEPEPEESAEALGQLSLDENAEVRYHGEASGLHLLGQSDRTDDRKDGGIWNLPMARVWPRARSVKRRYPDEDDVRVELPPIEEQDQLIDLYFTYFHPSFPVLHKRLFLEAYAASKIPSNASLSQSSQKLSKLLLFSIFSISDRFRVTESADVPPGNMHEEGCDYLDYARLLLNQVYHHSRVSTCQALLLLGVREFGIGSLEHGWLYIGMATHMAQDLGLHRALDKWEYHGKELFSADDKQVRRQVWWCAHIADKYVSVYMGRPVCVKGSDFDTALPELEQQEEEEPWQPDNSVGKLQGYAPVPSCLSSCFRAMASLSVIIGEIVDKIYPIHIKSGLSRINDAQRLETKLYQWYIGLPDCLQYQTASTNATPPPHVLFLHMQYWSTKLLLHRAFFPKSRKEQYESLSKPQAAPERASEKTYDICQNAASRVSAIANAYNETFGLRRSPPFLTSYILGAGIMHIVTLSARPDNVQASLGLRQCLSSLEEMGIAWPSASRALDLLNGVKVQFEGSLTPLVNAPARHKRSAEEALEPGDYSAEVKQEEPDYGSLGYGGYQNFDSRTMAQILGFDVPDVASGLSDYRGNNSWPLTIETHSSQPWAALSQLDYNLGYLRPYDDNAGQDPQANDWMSNIVQSDNAPFTFDPYAQYRSQ